MRLLKNARTSIADRLVGTFRSVTFRTILQIKRVTCCRYLPSGKSSNGPDVADIPGAAFTGACAAAEVSPDAGTFFSSVTAAAEVSVAGVGAGSTVSVAVVAAVAAGTAGGAFSIVTAGVGGGAVSFSTTFSSAGGNELSFTGPLVVSATGGASAVVSVFGGGAGGVSRADTGADGAGVSVAGETPEVSVDGAFGKAASSLGAGAVVLGTAAVSGALDGSEGSCLFVSGAAVEAEGALCSAAGFEAGWSGAAASGFVASGFVDSGFVASGFVASGFVASGFVASGTAVGVVDGFAGGSAALSCLFFFPRLSMPLNKPFSLSTASGAVRHAACQ